MSDRDLVAVGIRPVPPGAVRETRTFPLSVTGGRVWPAYAAAFVLWALTRWAVLAYQGDWLWMNSFVVDTARDIMAGRWREVVRPPLPSVFAIPLLQMGASDHLAVALVYFVASMLEFAAFALVVRLLFRDRPREQLVSLLLFLILPMNHSIHTWRNIPTVIQAGAVFLLSAHWLWSRRAGASPWTPASVVWAGGAIALGLWSRTEMLVFAVLLGGLAVLLFRAAAARVAALYVVAALVAFGAVTVHGRLVGDDPGHTSSYQIHTFFDSTPASWLSEGCRLYPTETCRDEEGEAYFAPVDRRAGLLKVILDKPLPTVARTAQSAVDNLWIMFGANISTYPTLVWLVGLAWLASAPVRVAFRALPRAIWPATLAALAVTVLPPLSWAPAHPQYHLHTLLPAMVLAVPALAALLPTTRGRVVAMGFLLGNAALSAFRYTRYPGY